MKKKPSIPIHSELSEELRSLAGEGDTADNSAETQQSGAEKSQEKKEEQKSDELYDRLVRLTADFENFRKRTQREKADLIRYGNETVMKELLPVLDNFQRALEHVGDAADIQAIRTGIELIHSQLMNALDRSGLVMQPSLGKPFNPLVHEAVSHVPSKDHPPNTVIEEHQKAYFLQDRLLRPALVTVSKSVETQEAATEAPATEENTDTTDQEPLQ